MNAASKALSTFVVSMPVFSMLTWMSSARAVTAQPEQTVLVQREGRGQFGVKGSGTIAVWEDRQAPASLPDSKFGGQADPTLGTSDVFGMDIRTKRVFEVATGSGDQAEPDIAGDTIVWQDSRHSCPTCDLDVMGYNLTSGRTFVIASGPADQAHPSVSDSSVTWLESDDQSSRVMVADLETLRPFVVAIVPKNASPGRPAISDRFVVWSEISDSPPHRLLAFDVVTRETSVVASLTSPQSSYSTAGGVITWTDPDVIIMDMDTGVETRMASGRAANVAISDDIVTWGARSLGVDTGIDIYGMRLGDELANPLVVAPGNQGFPIVVDGLLIWQQDRDSGSQLIATPFAKALSTGRASLNQALSGTPLPEAPGIGAVAPAYTRPTSKGMHVAIGDGWRVLYNGSMQPCNASSCPAIDALKSGTAPMFGSFLVLHTDLTTDTGRDSPLPGTNTSIADWLKYWQSSYGARPVVRLWPNVEPNSAGTGTPDAVAQKIINLATLFDWIQHVQVDNEPNLEEGWHDVCKDGQSGCTWVTNGVTRTYRWSGVYDYRKYQAINQFYVDAWYTVDYYRNNHPNATVRSRLQAMQLWTPPMSDIYRLLDNGTNFYDHLQGMMGLYGRMTYHTYPAPNYDADGSGGIVNNSWSWFNLWVQGQINSGSMRTMITEFGWNPGQMMRADCFGAAGLTQNSTWPASSSAGCRAGDGVSHLFESDLNRFLTYQRHGAEAVTVWLVRGWSDGRADGLDSSGLQKRWFQNYRTSSP